MRRVAFAIALLVAAIGCGKGKGALSLPPPPPPPSEPPGAPTGLVIQHVSFGFYLVSWTPPAGPLDGYEMQDRINGGPFEPLNGPPIDGRSTQLQVFASTPDDIHELDFIEVRLRAVRFKLASDWSNVAGVREIMLPGEVHAAVTLAPRPNDPGTMNVPPIVATIVKHSVVATEMKLERAEVPGSGGSVVWVRLPPTDPSVTTFSDANVLDGTAYQYRVSFGAQGVWSDTAQTSTNALDVFAPVGLTASLLPPTDGHPAGVHLAWTNRSATADSIAVSALQFGPAAGPTKKVATVPAATGAMDDLTAWPFWPVMGYRVAAQRTGYFATPGFSDLAFISPYVLSGPVTLDARTMSVPVADKYLFDGAGRIHARLSGQVPRLFRPLATGWESHDLFSVLFMLPPGLALDAADHPHVVHEVDVPSGPRLLRHVWHDGTSWISEEVPIGAAVSPLAFAPDPAGHAHVIYTTGLFGGGDLVHLSNESGTWVSTPLPDVPAAISPTRSPYVAPDGTVYVSVIGFPGTALGIITRAPDGKWFAEQVPGVDGQQTAWFFPADRGHAAFAFERFTITPANTNEELWYVAQGATGWGNPELIASQKFNGSSVSGSVAIGADGSRPFLVVGFPDASGKAACELFTRSATWSSMTVGPGCFTNAVPTVGADGKLRMVVNLGRLTSSTGVPVFTEQ